MLSLCMIVRDEEARLPRVVESVRGLVDEIVIVDTGSQDRTVEIAGSLGARVDRIPWTDDFAAARNRSLSLARGDWILVLDAGDEFERDDIPLAKKLLATTRADGLIVQQSVPFAGGHVWRKNHLAFVRNLPGLRYEFRVHESIPIDPARVETTALRIRNRGYGREILPARRARNERLLRLMTQDPNSRSRAAAHYYLGCILENDWNLAQAAEEYAAAAYSDTPTNFKLFAVLGLARVSSDLGDNAFAGSLYEALSEANPGAIEVELGLAELRLRQNRKDQARIHYERALRSTRRLLPYSDDPLERQLRGRLSRLLGASTASPAEVKSTPVKIGAAIPVMNEWTFMPAVVGQLLKIVDRCVILRGGRSLSGAPAKPGPIPKLDPRVEIVEGIWRDEAATRNAGMEILSDCDYVLAVDSDEIFTDRDLQALKQLCATREHRAIAVRLLTYWKTPEHRIDPPEKLIACVALRKDVRFKHLRMIEGEVTVADLWCRHLSYVRTDEELQEKLRLFGHAKEIRPNWYEEVWKAWDSNPKMENLHPTHPAAYARAVYDPDPDLNGILSKFDCAWGDRREGNVLAAHPGNRRAGDTR